MPSSTVDGRHDWCFGMTDLFGTRIAPKPRIRAGDGNGRFLGHLANGMPKAEILRNIEAGEYPYLHPSYLALIGERP